MSDYDSDYAGDDGDDDGHGHAHVDVGDDAHEMNVDHCLPSYVPADSPQ